MFNGQAHSFTVSRVRSSEAQITEWAKGKLKNNIIREGDRKHGSDLYHLE